MTDFKSRYKVENLFIGSYGRLVYIPKISLLSQLNLDEFSIKPILMENHNKKKTKKKEEDKGTYYGTTINTPVPPSPSDSMENTRTKETFPLGTTVDPETGEELRIVDFVLEQRSIANQIVFSSDPDDRSIIYYVDDNGTMVSAKLGNIYPVASNMNSVLHSLESKIKVPNKEWAHALEAQFYVTPSDKSKGANTRRSKLSGVSNVDFNKAGGVPLFSYSINFDMQEFVHSELEKIELAIKNGRADVKDKQLGAYYAGLVCTVLLSDQHSTLFLDLQTSEEETLRTSSEDAPYVPHIKGDTRFLPHQAYVASFLKDRKAAMVDADPGAGKTLMILADVLNQMNKGNVFRPLIVMPNSLLSQQKFEFESWTRGTVNFIVLSTSSIKKLDPDAGEMERGQRAGLPAEGSHNKGMVAAQKLIQSAPKNTILITSYSWLREDHVDTPSGLRFKRPRWLKRLGVDMVVLDESHTVSINANNNASKRAQAVQQLSSVPYKRCYSGTTSPGSPADIFLQVHFLDPSVLGSDEDFLARYGASVSPSKQRGGTFKKIEAWRRGAIKELQEVISKRIGVSVRRSAWLDQLPKMQVNLHKATLTMPQSLVYERLMDKIIHEDLLGDMDPGTQALACVKEMKELYSNNPAALSRLNSWQPSTTVSISAISNEGKVLESEEEYAVDEDKSYFSIKNPENKKAYEAARARIANLIGRYEGVKGDTEDLPDLSEEIPLLTKFTAFEKFLNDPTSDDFGNSFLHNPEDRVSPKIKVIDEILAKHFSSPNSGKVIIFTRYKNVANHIKDNIQMSSDAVYYSAGEKEALASFKEDSSVKIIVGVEQSIAEGQNLQMASRIIRVDLPWKPGQYEQSIARAYRLPPRDPDAARFPTIDVDLIFCEGTAEITKFARMISKMHEVRQYISGYEAEDSDDIPIVKMTLASMLSINTFSDIEQHIAVWERMRNYEIEESKLAPKIYGTKLHEVATGEDMDTAEGERIEKIETPSVESDESKTIWNVKKNSFVAGQISPTLRYMDGEYYLVLPNQSGMRRLIYGFGIRYIRGLLLLPFASKKGALDIFSALRMNGIHVLNQIDLTDKIKGELPCDPLYPQSIISVPNHPAEKTASFIKNAVFSDYTPNDASQVEDILAYNPSQADLQTARSLLEGALVSIPRFKNKEVTDIHVLATAKILGLFDADVSTLEVHKVWRATYRFTSSNYVRKILTEQLSSSGVPSPTPSVATPSPAEQAAQQELQQPDIPGLEQQESVTGIPITLGVSILGSLVNGNLSIKPCFIITDETAFDVPGLREKATETMKNLSLPVNNDESVDLSFKHHDADMLWLKLGQTLSGTKEGIRIFSRRVYSFGYTLSNPAKYLQMMKDVGFSEAEITKIWPKKEVNAMLRLAKLLEDNSDFQDITRYVYS